MSRIHHIQDYQKYNQYPLDIGTLKKFDADIANLTQTEQRRRRLDYLRESALQMRTQQSGPGTLMTICAVIPILWGFFIILWFLRKNAKAKKESELENALEYWGIHEIEVDAYISDDLDDL